jgi:hypothetical protein
MTRGQAAVVERPDGPSFGAVDYSCVDPPLTGPLAPYRTFSNAQYSGANSDGEDASLSRAGEGVHRGFRDGRR